MNVDIIHNDRMLEPEHHSVGSAVGVPQRHWFIARMRKNNTEKASAQQLSKLGYECYVATQQETRVWKNGKKASVERVVIPSVLFVKSTEEERRHLVNMPFISRFMTNNAAAVTGAHRPIATVSDTEIEKLRFMLGASDTPVSFVERFVKGQTVRVIRGPLRNLVGEILCDADGTSRLYVNIDILGCASLFVDANDVELLK